MNTITKLHAYRLIGLSVSGPFWPVCHALTLGLVMCAGYMVGATFWGEPESGLRGCLISSLLGVPLAFYSPALVGIAHTVKVRNQYGSKVSAALLTCFAKVRDGDAPNDT